MEENDSGKFWQVIHWKREISPDEGTIQPTDNQFKTHFEEILNPVTEEDGKVNLSRHQVFPFWMTHSRLERWRQL